jgi:uncharacterized protein YxjI
MKPIGLRFNRFWRFLSCRRRFIARSSLSRAVRRTWFRLTDSYGVEIESGQNDILILAITVAIDMMVHD